MSKHNNCTLSPWTVGGVDVISKELLRWAANEGHKGSLAAVECGLFIAWMQSDGNRNIVADFETGYPLVYYTPNIVVNDHFPIIYGSTIGSKGILPLARLLRVNDPLARQRADDFAIGRTIHWSKPCPYKRGEPWLMEFDRYRQLDGDLNECLRVKRFG